MRLSGFKIEGKYDLAMCLIEIAPTMIAEHVLTYMDRQAYISQEVRRSREHARTRCPDLTRQEQSGKSSKPRMR